MFIGGLIINPPIHLSIYPHIHLSTGARSLPPEPAFPPGALGLGFAGQGIAQALEHLRGDHRLPGVAAEYFFRGGELAGGLGLKVLRQRFFLV